MEDLSKLSLADLISTLEYLEFLEFDITYFLELAEKARKENDPITQGEIELFNELKPRIDIDEDDFYSPDKIKEMRDNLEIVTSKIFSIRKELDKKLQLPIVDVKETLKYFKEYISLTDKTKEAYIELKRRGEITKEMIRDFTASRMDDKEFYNHHDEKLKDKFPIWSKVVGYLIEEKGENLTSKNYRSIQDYIKRFCI